jgi:hypothetical protein
VLFENLIEIGNSVVSAVVGYFGNRGAGVDEHIAGLEDPDLIQVVEKMPIGPLLKEPAKALGRKAGNAGNISQRNISIEIVLDVLVYLAEPVGGLSLIIRVIGVTQDAMGIGGGRQDMQDLQQEQDPPESAYLNQYFQFPAYFVPGGPVTWMPLDAMSKNRVTSVDSFRSKNC